MKTFSTLLVAALFVGVPARADEVRKPPLEDVGIDQRLNEPLPLDLVFRDEAGRPVRLGDYFGSKPVVLTFVYYRCPMLCTLVLNGLVSSLETISFDVGKEFSIVTVSVDPRETPELAAAKKETYLKRYGRDGAAEGWHFLTGDEAAVSSLARAAGFRFTYDAEQNLFAHAAGIMVVTPEGRLARYFYGIEYAPRDLRLALVEASQNRIGSIVDRMLLLCYEYDPATGKYGAAIMGTMQLAGIATVLAIVGYIVVMVRRETRRVRSKPA